jgi:hypothetical protein
MFVGAAQAEWIPPSWTYKPHDENNTIDRPAQEASQSGWANDPRWQMLGDSWGVANGVTWTMLDGSGNPGTFGNDVVRVGAEVVFKFVMHKTLWGTHSLDGLRAWVDWDQDGFSASDLLIEDQYLFNPAHPLNPNKPAFGYSDDPRAWDSTGNRSLYYADVDVTFFSTPVIFTETGVFDLLARVTCSRDLGAWRAPDTNVDFDKLTPWPNGLSQGEVERYSVKVVPLPASLLLLGSGLFSIGFFRRRSGSDA